MITIKHTQCRCNLRLHDARMLRKQGPDPHAGDTSMLQHYTLMMSGALRIHDVWPKHSTKQPSISL